MPHLCHVLVSFSVFGSHARLRCMCTCNRCTFCLCQNFLNSELVQTVRTKLYTVVFSRFSGCFYLASLLFLCLLLISFVFIFIHSLFFLHYSHADSHTFSFIQLLVLAWNNVLINFWIFHIVIILYRLYENALWRGPRQQSCCSYDLLWTVTSFQSWAVDFWMGYQAFLDTFFSPAFLCSSFQKV